MINNLKSFFYIFLFYYFILYMRLMAKACLNRKNWVSAMIELRTFMGAFMGISKVDIIMLGIYHTSSSLIIFRLIWCCNGKVPWFDPTPTYYSTLFTKKFEPLNPFQQRNKFSALHLNKREDPWSSRDWFL